MISGKNDLLLEVTNKRGVTYFLNPLVSRSLPGGPQGDRLSSFTALPGVLKRGIQQTKGKNTHANGKVRA
ncbi:hypothetical protein DESC_260049 [Desulfosarcina cetonica]|nr:hypothetical protein DESC_260049 [Desulfosarcina cetonica]